METWWRSRRTSRGRRDSSPGMELQMHTDKRNLAHTDQGYPADRLMPPRLICVHLWFPIMTAGPDVASPAGHPASPLTLADFDYSLPPERIAHEPARPRDSARMLHIQPGCL